MYLKVLVDFEEKENKITVSHGENTFVTDQDLYLLLSNIDYLQAMIGLMAIVKCRFNIEKQCKKDSSLNSLIKFKHHTFSLAEH